MSKTVQAGDKFGYLTINEVYKDERGYRKCKCICDCGNQTEVYMSNLVSGRTRSCGHLEKSNQQSYIDMTGQHYGKLTVLKPTKERYDQSVVWLCQCKCGNMIKASRKQLLRGYVKECKHHELNKIIGKQFGELTVESIDYRTNKIKCLCSCGATTFVAKGNLLNGHTKSCGHLQRQNHFETVNGTIPVFLMKKKPKNNTSGVKGVSQAKSGKWVAYINLCRKRYTLGSFSTLAEAITARKKAEKELFAPILENL